MSSLHYYLESPQYLPSPCRQNFGVAILDQLLNVDHYRALSLYFLCGLLAGLSFTLLYYLTTTYLRTLDPYHPLYVIFLTAFPQPHFVYPSVPSGIRSNQVHLNQAATGPPYYLLCLYSVVMSRSIQDQILPYIRVDSVTERLDTRAGGSSL